MTRGHVSATYFIISYHIFFIYIFSFYFLQSLFSLVIQQMDILQHLLINQCIAFPVKDFNIAVRMIYLCLNLIFASDKNAVCLFSRTQKNETKNHQPSEISQRSCNTDRDNLVVSSLSSPLKTLWLLGSVFLAIGLSDMTKLLKNELALCNRGEPYALSYSTRTKDVVFENAYLLLQMDQMVFRYCLVIYLFQNVHTCMLFMYTKYIMPSG